MKKKIRILLLLKFPLYGGGSGAFTRRLAQKLVETGRFEVAIAAPDKRQIPGIKVYQIKPAFKAVFESHPEWRRAVKYSELTSPEFNRQYISFMKGITQVVEDFRPDVIHVNHAHFLTWLASFIKSIFGITYIVSVHGTDIFNTTIDRRYLVLLRQAVQRAEQIIAVSPHTKKWFLKVCGKKFAKQTRVITHAIDADSYSQEGDSLNIDEKYKLQGRKLVLFVGRLTKEKGVEYLIKAAKDIDGKVFIIGDGVRKDYLVNYTKLIGVKNVQFLGYFGKKNSDFLKEFYHRADVLVLPSIVDESLGLVVLEAMAARTPVVASNKGGIPLVIKDGYNGFLIRARSPKAITESVNKILNNEKLAAKMADNAYKTVIEKFDWNVVVPQFESVYIKAAEMTHRLQANLKKSIFDREDIIREEAELKEKIDYDISVFDTSEIQNNN